VPVPIDQLVQEFLINGYVVFEDFIPSRKAEDLHGTLLPMLEKVRARNSKVLGGDLTTGRGRVTEPLRYKIETPWMMPFSDPALYENARVLQVLERLWGSSEILISDYISYHPSPGCSALNWHRDGELFAPNVVLPVFPCLSLKIALVDTNEQNGSFELLPSTHHCGVPELSHVPGSGGGQGLNRLIESGRYPSKMHLNLKRGSAFICDARVIHRGTPNRSDHVRMELDIGYRLSWYDPRNHPIRMTARGFEELSERGKQLLSQSQRVEALH
jgi:ectoine hydroxylase-related dioxygenase (phytanoyl-CoA dioxygenase family)